MCTIKIMAGFCMWAEAAAGLAASIPTHKAVKETINMKDFPVKVVEKVLGIKLLILSLIVLSLTLAKPASIVAHQGTQKICSFIMRTDDCARHC
jgi:formate-dependent nitrite reductase membrane component NrfD